jgi:hypothetical protein
MAVILGAALHKYAIQKNIDEPVKSRKQRHTRDGGSL